MVCHVFGRWIEVDDIVEVAMVKLVIQPLLETIQCSVVNDKPHLIELMRSQMHSDNEVVSMQASAGMIGWQARQLMRSAEGKVLGDFVHRCLYFQISILRK